MPNGYDYEKEYGPHKYADHDGTSDCKHGCGCWMGPTNSGSRHTGVDPFGRCPGNPVNGKSGDFHGGNVGGAADVEIVIVQRIRRLQARAYKAEELLKKVGPSKKILASTIEGLKKELTKLKIREENALKALRG